MSVIRVTSVASLPSAGFFFPMQNDFIRHLQEQPVDCTPQTVQTEKRTQFSKTLPSSRTQKTHKGF
jgi:hypothetical protein